MRALLALALAACSIPTEEDVARAVDDCRVIVQDEIPGLVAQVTLAAAVVCGQVGDETRDAIMLYLGCLRDPAVGWDCSGARARACEGVTP